MNQGLTILAEADLPRPKSVQLVRDPEGQVGLATTEDGAWEITVSPSTPEEARKLAAAVIIGNRQALTGQHTIRILAAHLVAALDTMLPPADRT